MVLTSVLTPRKKPRKKQNDDFFNKNDLENDQKVFFYYKSSLVGEISLGFVGRPNKIKSLKFVC
jgi:hypothetical protein